MAVLVPHSSAGWRYKQIGRTDATDYSGVGFDDSAWATGQTTFGRNSIDAGAGCYDTCWDVDTRLWVRRSVPTGAGTVTISGRIDNEIVVYWDGTQKYSFSTVNPADYSTSFTTTAATHVLSIQATDDAFVGNVDGTFLTVQVEGPTVEPWTVGRVAFGAVGAWR